MRTGHLRDRVDVIRRGAGTDDGAGGRTRPWVRIAAGVPVAFWGGGGRESLQGGAVQVSATWKVTLRWRPEVDERVRLVATDTLTVTPGTHFEVLGARDPTSRHIWIELDVIEVPAVPVED